MRMAMSDPQVLCSGIVVADHVCTPISHVPGAGEIVMADGMLLTIGGCAANAAVDLVKMGVGATVAGRVGQDACGRVVADLLREHGVDISGLKFTAGAETSQTLIVNVAGEDRRFIHTFGANAEFRAGDIPAVGAARYRVLYVGGYLLMPNMEQDELVPVFADARKNGVKTLLDVATPGPAEYLPRLERLLPHVDVFLPNNHEGQMITGESDPWRQADVFLGLGAGTVVITLGGDGAVLVNAKQRLRAGTYAVPYVDGTGSGDAFDAGYICGQLNDMDAEGCLRVASALGASCVRTIGTTPGVFTREECEKFLRSNELRIQRC
jgi:sugar/nucleoside kinase (ribokinase family)